MEEAIEIAPTHQNPDQELPLCVDYDGTVLLKDTAVILFFEHLKRKPWALFKIIQLLIQDKGRKALLKDYLADNTELDISKKPYNEGLIRELRTIKATGRRMCLVTGTPSKIVERVNAHLGLFDDVWGSNERVNLVGRNKATFLSEKFGDFGFDYIGNSEADYHIWKISRKRFVANRSVSFAKKMDRKLLSLGIEGA